MPPNQLVIAAVDVGKLANVGWWRIAEVEASGGRDLDDLVTSLAADLNEGRPVALGFEAPLFIPNPSSTGGLGRQREGEAGRPWCAGAGTITLAFGVQQASYVAHRIAGTLHRPIRAGVDAESLLDGSLDLLIWEAFVSAGSKDRAAADPHISDARAAAEEFQRRAATGHVRSDIAATQVLNLVAAALLASGLATDTSLLTSPCVVVKSPRL
ncbi:hypothetical protein IU459_34150 [Nocardia amamiensis]|uniref:DUF429 domain-containing protein n=1 Tax=Nocardia amamiensis TaxID=404578 RepID=A0ABS0D150_9NOCA|nr:hypothetical protein [Nocardia amamiensis]MBF6302547.1 hypothetical protein [Nocardia amamiensis]